MNGGSDVVREEAENEELAGVLSFRVREEEANRRLWSRGDLRTRERTLWAPFVDPATGVWAGMSQKTCRICDFWINPSTIWLRLIIGMLLHILPHGNINKESCIIYWRKPTPPYVKINTDGLVKILNAVVGNY